ncbi:MAG: sigma-70 family RNA polymerase sigma factor [Burkholderiaceae bacterium]
MVFNLSGDRMRAYGELHEYSGDAASPRREALDELLASYADLCRYLQSRLRNSADAYDIAQSSFAQAYAHALEHPVANARALLFQAARNLWIDGLRRRRSESTLDAWLATRDDAAPSAERIVVARQQLARVIARIERMPRLRRDVFARVRLHGHTHAEVGAALGLSQRAVEQHVARAVFDLSELAVNYRSGLA